jgi:hypothetical protein
VEVLVDARIGRGMVIMPVGTWIKRGGSANVLTEDVMSNFGQMAAYGETRVRIERIRRLTGNRGPRPPVRLGNSKLDIERVCLQIYANSTPAVAETPGIS